MTKTMSSVNIYNTGHCLTKPQIEVIHYTWTIADFAKIYSCAEFYSSKIKNYFRLYMSTTKDNLKLYIKDISNKKIKASYYIYVQTDNEINNFMDSRSIIEIYTNDLLCELSFSKKTTSKFLFANNKLTLYFIFHILHDFSNSSISHLYDTTAQLYNRNTLFVPSLFDKTNSVVPNEKSDSLVTFVIKNRDEECLQVNKDLLCSHSAIFKAMFQCGLKESADNKVEITDTSYYTLKELLSFLQQGYLSQNIKTDREALCELFITAEKYDIKNLKIVCQEHLIINTTIKNVIEHLKLAHLNGGDILANYARELIKLHFEEIEDTREFEDLVQNYPELLTQIKSVNTVAISCAKY